ncbi:hypothetical protein [Bacterioplanoides pacificum]|uniref:ABC transmembrane type-1 domain-containing protein n=1 Tax=Bacterioplanoides pacificum TaxID=1171596 RepID=A0ABV7VSI5_9GAMM
MAYDFGSQALGISNPFKTEGKIRLVAGLIISALAMMPLLQVADTLKQDPARAWGFVAIGLFLLTWGLRSVATAAMQLFRFYVGRSVPSSLAYNHSASERENAQAEKQSGSLAYDAEKLESMLMGRKNTTFEEPQGWLARLVHSLIPGLIFAPYPLRNFVQELAAVLSSTIIALAAFAVASFITATGLAGGAGGLIEPLMSLLLLIYLVVIWRSAAANMNTGRNQKLHKKTAAGISRLFVFAIVVPVLIGFGYDKLTAMMKSRDVEQLNALLADITVFSAWSNLMLLALLAVVVMVPALFMVRERLKLAQKNTRVSEFRENMQESVHPNEIFINIENIVLANRRYKEIPNRIYRDFEPQLMEQSQGKGTFKGQLLIETQPEYKPMKFSALFRKIRLFSTIGGQLLTVGSAVLLYWLFNMGFDSFNELRQLALAKDTFSSQESGMAFFALVGNHLDAFLTMLFAFLTVSFAGRILANLTHLLWSEMQFSSLLMSMKTEGTYTESKISTGMAYNDSTRSENVVVRSSITPWVLTARVVSSTYATSGMQNLEMPRLILEMDANDQELDTIVHEIRTFLKGREFIASINNEQDLANAERIYQVNQISKSDDGDMKALAQQEAEAAAVLQQHQADASSENIGSGEIGHDAERENP